MQTRLTGGVVYAWLNYHGLEIEHVINVMTWSLNFDRKSYMRTRVCEF